MKMRLNLAVKDIRLYSKAMSRERELAAAETAMRVDNQRRTDY